MIKPRCIICDIDGTLALRRDRKPHDLTRVFEDDINTPVQNILRAYAFGNKEFWFDDDIIFADELHCDIFLVSGRQESCRSDTERWLHRYKIDCDYLYMRADDDYRKDSLVKKEIYDKHIKDTHDVMFVLDDRNQTVDMWRKELGLTCLQVNYGDF